MRRILAFVKRIFRNRWVFRAIGLILFALILLRIDLNEAYATLKQVNLWFVLLSIGIQLGALVIATSRWQVILRQLNIHVPFHRSFIHQLIGTSAALLTPGQLGEFVKVVYHRREGFPAAESALSVVLDRLCDLFVLLAFGFISLVVLIGIPPGWVAAILAAFAGLGIGLIVFLRKKQDISHWLATVFVRMSPKAYKDAVRQNAERLAERVVSFDRKFITTILAISLGNYILLLMRVYAIILAVHIVMPLWYFIMAVPLLRLVGLLPISVLGIGTRDVTSIYLYGQVGVPATSALVSSTLGLLTLQVQTLIGLIVSWRYPLQARAEAPIAPQETPARD